MSRFEFHQNINVTLWTEVVSQNRTKQRQFADMMATAEVSDFIPINGDFDAHKLSSLQTLQHLAYVSDPDPNCNA